MKVNKLMLRILIICCCTALALFSCRKKSLSASAADEQISVQAMKVADEEGSTLYNIRIYPQKEILTANPAITQKMIYEMDSCFYTMKGLDKQYPQDVQFIANGVANSFEYLVRFDSVTNHQLIYQDKYINQGNYKLLLK